MITESGEALETAFEFTSLNALAERWSLWVVEGFLASSVVLLSIYCLWRVLRKRTSAHVGYVLFLLPLVPLTFPVSSWLPDSPLPSLQSELGWLAEPTIEPETPGPDRIPDFASTDSLSGTLNQAHSNGAIVVKTTSDNSSQASIAQPNTTASTAGQLFNQTAPLHWRTWLMLAWAGIVLALLLRAISVQWRTHRLIQSAQDLDRSRLPSHLQQLEVLVGLPKAVRMVELPGLTSPAVWGLRRPVLILPMGKWSNIPPNGLRWMLLHELIHLRRGDLLVSALQRCLQILWFFHPVAWWSHRMAEELRECAADEGALARCLPSPGATSSREHIAQAEQRQRRSCAELLIDFSTAARTALDSSSSRFDSLALQPFLGRITTLERRIMRLTDTQRTATPGLGLAALPSLAAAGLLALSSAALAVGGNATHSGSSSKEHSSVSQSHSTQQSASKAAKWLIKTQLEDGGWGVDPANTIDWSGEFNRHGVTGWALLALNEHAQSAADSELEAVQTSKDRARAFLAQSQDESGCFGKPGANLVYMPSHIVAMHAWLATSSGQLDAEWRPQAERALNYLLKARNPYGAWRYHSPPNGENDSFVTSLALRSLALAKQKGFEFERHASNSPLLFLKEMTDNESGRIGYATKGSPVSRLADKRESFPVEYTEMLTAIGLLAQWDWAAEVSPEVAAKGANLVANTPPLWSTEFGSIDYYHWLFGTQLLSRVGGAGWERWRLNLHAALLTHQNQDGSWPAIDAWSAEQSTNHATAICLLAVLAAKTPNETGAVKENDSSPESDR